MQLSKVNHFRIYVHFIGRGEKAAVGGGGSFGRGEGSCIHWKWAGSFGEKRGIVMVNDLILFVERYREWKRTDGWGIAILGNCERKVNTAWWGVKGFGFFMLRECSSNRYNVSSYEWLWITLTIYQNCNHTTKNSQIWIYLYKYHLYLYVYMKAGDQSCPHNDINRIEFIVRTNLSVHQWNFVKKPTWTFKRYHCLSKIWTPWDVM